MESQENKQDGLEQNLDKQYEFELQDRAPEPVMEKKKSPLKMFFRWLLVTLSIVLVLLLGINKYINDQFKAIQTEAGNHTSDSTNNAFSSQQFEVVSGWGANKIASELEKAGLIRNAGIFAYYLRLNRIDRKIGEGLYELSPTMTMQEIALALSKGGQPRTVNVLIPEGFRIKDVARRFAETGLWDRQALLDAMTKVGELKPDYIPEGASLEGYLFPANYKIPISTDYAGLIKLMLNRFEQNLSDDNMKLLKESGLSINDWVTLASIVQAEAANFDEMPIIAGVFRNRLDQSIPLQSDPTVAYGLGKDLPDLDAIHGDMKKDHPWNTYTRMGLPLSPISNPGKEALDAVLRPIRQDQHNKDYLFFLHGYDKGVPVFKPNTTLKDHNRDVRLYLR